MSGIEIVGLVLGALPLFISAAEHYRDSVDFVKRALKKKQFLKQYKDELDIQRTLLCLYIKGAVGRTTLPPKTQAQLIDELDGDAWQRPEVIKELSNELGDAYQPFVALLIKICATLAKQIRCEGPTKRPSTDDELVSTHP
jgi:hypothetical protein